MEQMELFTDFLEPVVPMNAVVCDDPKAVWNYGLDGMHLIEASAGTGKTYTIMNLYLRFVLEQRKAVGDILVVTFTEAATKELKSRIRTNLHETDLWVKTVANGSVNLDEVVATSKNVNELITAKHLLRAGVNDETIREAQLLIRRAVVGFDEASIFTIHGFCQRMLKENAFESGTLFDTTLISDQDDLIQEVVDDFWRGQIYRADKEMIELLNEQKFTRDELKRLANEFLKNPLLQLSYYNEDLDSMSSALKSVENSIVDVVRKVEEVLSQNVKQTLCEVLHQPAIFKKKFADEASLNTLIDKLIVGLQSLDKKSSWTKIKPFTAVEIEKAMTKKAIDSDETAPTHDWFNLFESLQHVAAFYSNRDDLKQKLRVANVNNLKVLFCSNVIKLLKQKKQTLNVMSFDDLLHNLQNALKSEDGVNYIDLIRQRFGVVMIDEFQDTDPCQYEIFNLLFGTESNCAFYMIGDPKQSIYKFRGADIFSYLDAKNQITDSRNLHGLDTNYRSESLMIDAVNSYFSSSTNPFVASAISFENVNAGGKADKEAKLVAKVPKQSTGALQFCWLNSENEKKLKKDTAIRKINNLMAEEIVNLLSGDYEFKAEDGETKTIKPQDIAVLVTRHAEARLVKEALQKRNVPAVVQNSGNIFDSLEVEELIHFLNAVIDPTELRIRTVLVTSLIGLNADQIEQLNDETFMIWYEFFVKCHEIWQHRDFMSMFRFFMQMTLGKVGDTAALAPQTVIEEKSVGLRTRLVALENGERILTNFLHLAELLHQQEHLERLSTEGVLSWLLHKKSDDGDDRKDDIYLQRLESDADAVKILTVHKSKGLEFPIVFCPFMWRSSFKPFSSKNFLYYDEAAKSRFYDIGSELTKDNLFAHKRESLQESLRLLYVALTRSRNRCYLYWGPINQSEPTALMYLTEQPEDADEFIEKAKGRIHFTDKKLDASVELALEKLNSLQNISNGSISVQQFDATRAVTTYHPQMVKEDARDLKCRSFNKEIEGGWGVGSFSSLTRNAHKVSHKLSDRNEGRDVDAVDQADEREEGVLKDFIDIPGGAALGSAVHQIFENIDFTNPDENLGEVVESALKKYAVAVGSDSDEKASDLELKSKLVKQMLLNTLAANIQIGDDSLSLSTVCNDNRLVEMKFYFRVGSISNELLSNVFKREGHGAVAREFAEQLSVLDFNLTNGFMNGAIDLIFKHNDKFYILDWKTTSCGKNLRDYSMENITESMFDHHYILQYHIYTAALHLYLKKRLPDYDYDRDFGGSIYAYLRGIVPEFPDNGFFFDKPPKSLIEAICTEIIGEGN